MDNSESTSRIDEGFGGEVEVASTLLSEALPTVSNHLSRIWFNLSMSEGYALSEGLVIKASGIQ